MYDQTPRPDLKFKPFVSRELALKTGASSIFETDSKAQRAAASPVRFVFGGGALHRERGAGSGRALDQADALSHEREFADRARADRRRGEERSGGGGGVEGAVRRSVQYSLGAKFAGSGRAGVSRRRWAEDALQTGARRAAGSERPDSPLRASGNRELQSFHRAVSTRI